MSTRVGHCAYEVGEPYSRSLLLQARGEVCDDCDRLIDLLRYTFHQNSFAIGRDAVKRNRQNCPLVDQGLGSTELKGAPSFPKLRALVS